MAAVILVHGENATADAWNKTKLLIENDGNSCYTPSFFEDDSSDLSLHINHLFELIQNITDELVFLVGHSYGGMIITGVAALCPTRVAKLIYLDAAVPIPQQSFIEVCTLAGEEFCSSQIIATIPPYLEKLHYTPQAIALIPKEYICCTKSSFLKLTAVSLANLKTELLGKNWQVFALDSGHTPMQSAPKELSMLLCQLFASK